MDTIKSSDQISEIFNLGVRFSSGEIRIIVKQTNNQRDPRGRVAFIAGKKLGNAVVRNRSKRVMREAARAAGLPAAGYDVLLMTDEVDEFVPQTLMTYMEKKFCNALSEDLGLQSEEEKKEAQAKAEQLKGFLTFVKETLGEQVKEVRLSSNLGGHPVCMTPEAGMSFEMEKYMKKANPEFAFNVGRILELNADHESVQAMQKAMTEDPLKAKDYAKLLCCQAQLMAELPLDDPYAYTELVCKLMK